MNAGADQDSSSSAAPPDTNTSSAGDGVVDVEGDTTEGTPGSNEQQESNVDASGSTEVVRVRSPKPVYNIDGSPAEVDAAVTTAIDQFSVPAGFVKKGERVDSFMYSLGVYVEEIGGKDHKFFCLATAKCRNSKKIIPCRKGDRSNVNTHLKKQHRMQGTEGAQKAKTKKVAQQSIQSAVDASSHSGVKHYAPSAENQAADKASEILFIVFKSVLSEFGVKISDLAGGTTDSGSDVKAMCVNFLLRQHKVSWDWCVCHLADRAAEHAFGTSADPQKSKNKDARAVVQLVIKAASKVNQSHVFKQKLDEAQLEMTGEVLKIRKHAPQRWLSLVHVMERIIRLWHVFRKVYANDGVEFPLDKGDNKDDILQLYSLLQPLAAITRDGQYGAVPMSAEMHMAFAELKQEVLDTTKPLRVFDIPPTPDSPAALQSDEEFPVTGKTAKKPLPHKLVEPAALRPVAAKTRGLLGEALVEKLYGRVWDEDRADPSPFRNAAVLLTPSYKDSKFLDAYALTEGDAQHLSESKAHLAPTLDDEVQSALDASWEDIRTRASDAARKKHAEAATVTDGQPPLKRFCTPNGAAKPRFASLARSRTSHQSADESDGDSALAVLMKQVSQEIERYQSLYITAEELDTRAILPWWQQTGRDSFPYLAPVAQQVLGNQAGAAQVERDFSSCANLLTRNRSRMDTYWVEMVMFLHSNLEHIPAFKNIPIIDAKDVHKCLPPRFNGGDADLAAAEAAFDVICNTKTGDVGL
eukprot:g4017.t1